MSQEETTSPGFSPVDLSTQAPALRHVRACLGWDAPDTAGGFDLDIDASVFLLGRHDRVRRDGDFVFYNNLSSEEGAVTHRGDDKTGAGPGDDEVIEVRLDLLPFDVEKIVFTASIHNAPERLQSFALARGAYIRLVDAETGADLARFDLPAAAASGNAVIFGALLRGGTGWLFQPDGRGHDGGLFKLAADFGVNVAPN